MKKFDALTRMGLTFLLFQSAPCSQAASTLSTTSFLHHPKLVVVLVIDQLRADYLTRFASDFLPAEKKVEKSTELGGFRYLMENGAYYPFAEYDVLQNMTCPGHAMIATGSRPVLNGIGMNEWYDQTFHRMHSCVENDHNLISPQNLRTSTVGDELKNISPRSKVISISLKDRAAIMLGGHRADLSLWLDPKKQQWQTSPFYRSELPGWVISKKVSKEDSSGEKSVTLTMDQALAALHGESLGAGASTDMLWVSFSGHDILGHKFGMHSKELAAVTILEDKEISRLLNDLQKTVGLENVIIALTGDHGIPPNVETSLAAKVPAARLDSEDLRTKASRALDKKFGSSGAEKWFEADHYFHFYLNEKLIRKKRLDVALVESEVKRVFMLETGVWQVFTRSDFERRILPPGIEAQILNSYLPEIGGNVVLIPQAFYMAKDGNVVTHLTHYSYDRTVPLIVTGASVNAQVHSDSVLVIDLAPTLAFLMAVTPPASNQGRVLPDLFR